MWDARHEPDKALADRQKALELIPASEQRMRYELRFSVGMNLAERGDYAAALPLFDALIAEAPRDSGHHWYRARCLQHQGRNQDALTDANQAIELEPNVAAYYRTRAEIWAAMGDKEKEQADRQRMAELVKEQQAR